ncbi:hypothetical protein TNIN_275801 [Trichonephila inaurata madagascariensis]|uniref:Uncharacterized protein n=1 Tax=Trichonephila inaurata madagascariensis TaxID=2747483 RepID=A0A8X7BU05_9ARAC|nr:hypothetical protein TNIN_275801 [Trichonephila inaurata madagascariensis]
MDSCIGTVENCTLVLFACIGPTGLDHVKSVVTRKERELHATLRHYILRIRGVPTTFKIGRHWFTTDSCTLNSHDGRPFVGERQDACHRTLLTALSVVYKPYEKILLPDRL